MKSRNCLFPIVAAWFFSGIGLVHAEQQTSYLRGYNLYGNHCIECHESVVHVREDRKAGSLQEVEATIARWAAYRKLSWNQEDINDVLHYLNTRYYQY